MTPDESRQAAASPDTEYSLSIDDAAAMYERAGLPRTLRTIQRYCAKGHLDSHRVETAYGEKFLITPASVLKHIAYIEEVRPVAASRGEPRPVAAGRDKGDNHTEQETGAAAASRDEPRQAEADTQMMSRYVARLEGENEFLRGQVTAKDKQIGELTERAHETNVLIGGLQQMLTPLLGRPATDRDDRPYGRGTAELHPIHEQA